MWYFSSVSLVNCKIRLKKARYFTAAFKVIDAALWIEPCNHNAAWEQQYVFWERQESLLPFTDVLFRGGADDAHVKGQNFQRPSSSSTTFLNPEPICKYSRMVILFFPPIVPASNPPLPPFVSWDNHYNKIDIYTPFYRYAPCILSWESGASPQNEMSYLDAVMFSIYLYYFLFQILLWCFTVIYNMECLLAPNIIYFVYHANICVYMYTSWTHHGLFYATCYLCMYRYIYEFSMCVRIAICSIIYFVISNKYVTTFDYFLSTMFHVPHIKSYLSSLAHVKGP